GWEDAVRQGRDPMSLRMEGSRKVLLNGEKLLEISAPVQFDKGVPGMIRVALSRERAEALLEREQKRGMVLMSFLGIIALLSMWLLYKNQNRHLRKMRAIEERLHQAQRLSALGRMAAGVAHEIRNPLNAISMACQRLNPDNIHPLSGVIREEVRRLDHIVEEFLSLSRHGRLAFRVQDIKPLIEHIVRLMDEESRSRGVQMVCEWREGPLPVPMDVDKMTQALLNIIKNAVEAVSDGGRVTLRVKEVGRAWARIEISDTGTGLTPEARKQVFDPGYTTKKKGLGLGLALAHEIIQGHGGQIRVMSEPDAGTTVEILLPLKR
ncbi:MAG: two-component system sensor histidine kinase NtrB, partial [Thermodesulfobacteriota bacterium]